GRLRCANPVVPIVRAHHEKWVGSGYRLGLNGEQIPMGARILSAVDFLDALASDRQYRRALPLKEVMTRLEEESGRSFDPKVVAVLEKRYLDLERLVEKRSGQVAWSKLPTEFKVERVQAPAAGLEDTGAEESHEANLLLAIG